MVIRCFHLVHILFIGKLLYFYRFSLYPFKSNRVLQKLRSKRISDLLSTVVQLLVAWHRCIFNEIFDSRDVFLSGKKCVCYFRCITASKDNFSDAFPLVLSSCPELRWCNNPHTRLAQPALGSCRLSK